MKICHGPFAILSLGADELDEFANSVELKILQKLQETYVPRHLYKQKGQGTPTKAVLKNCPKRC